MIRKYRRKLAVTSVVNPSTLGPTERAQHVIQVENLGGAAFNLSAKSVCQAGTVLRYSDGGTTWNAGPKEFDAKLKSEDAEFRDELYVADLTDTATVLPAPEKLSVSVYNLPYRTTARDPQIRETIEECDHSLTIGTDESDL